MNNPKDIIGVVEKYRFGLSPDALYCFHVMADKTMQEIQVAKRPMGNGAVFSPTRIESLQEVVQFTAGVLVDFPKIAQALLIAVEALGDIAGTEAGAIPGPRLHAAETLDRIRSL